MTEIEKKDVPIKIKNRYEILELLGRHNFTPKNKMETLSALMKHMITQWQGSPDSEMVVLLYLNERKQGGS